MHVRCGMHVRCTCVCAVRACAVRAGWLVQQPSPPFPSPLPPEDLLVVSIDIDEIEETIREDVNSCFRKEAQHHRPAGSQPRRRRILCNSEIVLMPVLQRNSCPSLQFGNRPAHSPLTIVGITSLWYGREAAFGQFGQRSVRIPIGPLQYWTSVFCG